MRLRRVFRKALVMLYTCFDIRALLQYYITIESTEDKPTVAEVLKSLEDFFISKDEVEK